jgi:two-component system phosphate regulon sensor histidine kinase PhoR
VIYNLLDNALKYSRDNPEIGIGLEEGNHQFAFSVHDNGPGIAAEYQDKIFDKFFRIPTGDQHNVKGYGLGLSYVAYVIRRHDGQVAVTAAPGGGSSFTVTLPKGL